MFREIIFLSAIVLVAIAQHDDGIVTKTFDLNPDGSFLSEVKTVDGIVMHSRGYLKDEDTLAIEGSYSYVSPEGENVQVTYVADENGYQPTGSHIPQVPEQIKRAIEYIRTHSSE